MSVSARRSSVPPEGVGLHSQLGAPLPCPPSADLHTQSVKRQGGRGEGGKGRGRVAEGGPCPGFKSTPSSCGVSSASPLTSLCLSPGQGTGWPVTCQVVGCCHRVCRGSPGAPPPPPPPATREGSSSWAASLLSGTPTPPGARVRSGPRAPAPQSLSHHLQPSWGPAARDLLPGGLGLTWAHGAPNAEACGPRPGGGAGPPLLPGRPATPAWADTPTGRETGPAGPDSPRRAGLGTREVLPVRALPGGAWASLPAPPPPPAGAQQRRKGAPPRLVRGPAQQWPLPPWGARGEGHSAPHDLGIWGAYPAPLGLLSLTSQMGDRGHCLSRTDMIEVCAVHRARPPNSHPIPEPQPPPPHVWGPTSRGPI